MTAPDIIEIAKKAAAEVREDADGLAYVGFYPRSFDRFAALYREALIASGEVVEREDAMADARDTLRYRKLKRHLNELGTIQHFVAFNGWHPSEAARIHKIGLDEAIDRSQP